MISLPQGRTDSRSRSSSGTWSDQGAPGRKFKEIHDEHVCLRGLESASHTVELLACRLKHSQPVRSGGGQENGVTPAANQCSEHPGAWCRTTGRAAATMYCDHGLDSEFRELSSSPPQRERRGCRIPSAPLSTQVASTSREPAGGGALGASFPVSERHLVGWGVDRAKGPAALSSFGFE